MSTNESKTAEDWGDKPIPEDAAIKAAHPIRTGRHDLYQEAQRMVGAKRGKYALVELVNWLLYRIAELETKLASFKPWPPPGVDLGGALAARLCSRCGERELDDPFYCAECSGRLALEHEVDVHKARIAELEKLLATEASDREAALAAEVARLKAIFDDAGQGEANVLGLIDHYQDRILELEKRFVEPALPFVESLRRRIHHQRREIRMLHRIRDAERAQRGRALRSAGIPADEWMRGKDAPTNRMLVVEMKDGRVVAYRDDNGAWWDCHIGHAGKTHYCASQFIDEPARCRELPSAEGTSR